MVDSTVCTLLCRLRIRLTSDRISVSVLVLRLQVLLSLTVRARWVVLTGWNCGFVLDRMGCMTLVCASVLSVALARLGSVVSSLPWATTVRFFVVLFVDYRCGLCVSALGMWLVYC